MSSTSAPHSPANLVPRDADTSQGDAIEPSTAEEGHGSADSASTRAEDDKLVIVPQHLLEELQAACNTVTELSNKFNHAVKLVRDIQDAIQLSARRYHPEALHSRGNINHADGSNTTPPRRVSAWKSTVSAVPSQHSRRATSPTPRAPPRRASRTFGQDSPEEGFRERMLFGRQHHSSVGSIDSASPQGLWLEGPIVDEPDDLPEERVAGL